MAKKNSESKAGLIIALVFFVLTSIVLGVLTYFGFSEQEQLRADTKAAKESETTLKKSRDAERVRLMIDRIAVGIEDKDDQTNLVALLGQKANQEAVAEELKKLEKYKDRGVAWESTKSTFARNFGQILEDAASDVATAKKKQATAEQERDQLKNDMEEERKVSADKLKKSQEALAAANAKIKEIQDQKSKAFLEATAKIEDQGKQMGALRQERADFEVTKKKETDALQGRIKALTYSEQQLKAKLKPVDLLDFEQPKARIVRIDRRTNTAIIDIGTADQVRPQLTFSVLPADATGKGAASKDRKGAVEVVRAIGPHESVAKFIEVADRKEPIIKGDLLFNPAWSPNLREHVAIAGIIDLAGDGRDHTDEFVRNLERQGVVVDAYLDIATMTIKGRGISERTSYLIVGDVPDGERLFQLGESRRVERIKEIGAKVADMRTKAKEFGVQAIGARRFIALIGYEVPKSIVPPDYLSNPSLTRKEPKEETPKPPMEGTGKPIPGGKPKPKPEEPMPK